MPCPCCNGLGGFRMLDIENPWEDCPMCCPEKKPDPSEYGFFKRLWRLFLARFHLSDSAVCEMSADRGPHNDYHDYHDTEDRYPDHFSVLTCKRCGKKFII